LQSSFDDIVFAVILVFPIVIFYTIARKHWSDKELNKAFWNGIISGCFAIFFVRLIYVPIEIYLGGEIRNFLAAPREWYITLIACIGIIGFVEEGFKTLSAHLVCCLNKEGGFRPTFVFMSFAGSALSFSFLENIQYYMVYGSSVVLPRVLVSSAAHLAFACICSYFSATAFSLIKSPIKTGFYLNIGILTSASLHGFFDFILFRYSLSVYNGLIIALTAFFLYLIYEIWIQALKKDIPPVGFLAVCSNCRALTVDRIRFCPFCGRRVKKIETLPTIIKKPDSD
jgi:hypothetical protein